MSEMVERMAKAAHDSIMGYPESSEWPKSAFSVDAYMFRDAARAALEALRIPTHEMLDAANAAGSPESPALPHEVWPAMIDAAIAGKGL